MEIKPKYLKQFSEKQFNIMIAAIDKPSMTPVACTEMYGALSHCFFLSYM